MKNKLLCGICIAIILSLSLCVLATAAHINLSTVNDMLPPPAGTDNGDRATDTDNNMSDMLPGNGNNILDDLLPNDTQSDTQTDTAEGTGNETDNMMGTDTGKNETTDSMGGTTDDMTLPETNVPDDDIGGAVGDKDDDNVPDAVDSDDDNDGIKDPIDDDADGDGVDDKEEGIGVVGIVIAVVAVVAVIAVVIAVMPKKNKN